MIKYAIILLIAILLHFGISAAIRKFGWYKENFRKTRIPSVYGLYIVLWGAVAAFLSRFSPYGSDPAARLYLIAILTFGILGFLDDTLGSRDVGGFRGHFRRLIREKKLTTGMVKAVVGGLAAIYLGYIASGATWQWGLNSAIIALAANTINLLDLRPGRAIFGFCLGMAVVGIAAFGSVSAPIPVLAVALATVGVAIYDCRGMAMLGDVGSNALGAALGLTLVVDIGVTGRIAAFIVFLGINIYSERYSISKLIERHPALAMIDSKLGVR